MRFFDREMDELEEWIVYLALVYLISSIILLFGVYLGVLAVFPILARSVSLIVGMLAVVLWLLRRFAGPLYARLRGPEENRIQSILSDRPPSADR